MVTEQTMAKQQMDDEANLKRQARRRLIGAVALVTAVVVILPMVLDSEPKLDGQNIELRIPDQNDAGEFKPRIALPPEPPAASEPAAASAAEKPSAAADVPVVTPLPAVPQETKPQPAPAPKPVAAAPKATAPKPASKPAVKTQSVPKQGYAVQVGAFSNAATAKKLQGKLSKQGLPAYTEKVGSNVRVRVGPYPTRAAAEKELNKLKAQGMRPVLSTLN